MRGFVSVVLLALVTPGGRADGNMQRPAEELMAGRKLYVSKCARCHKFYDPAKYDGKSWQTWMEKMRRKAHLNDEQYKQLSEYLQSVRAEAEKPLNAKTKQ
ncbi:MAG TPA: hypothetical protein VL486_08645 [Verrucomicrobiae bacterium]|nr:hypothetical protein [Verrucomicrobiae bacterium]